MSIIRDQKYLQTLGENLQLIMKKLLGNQNLLRYLYYTDMDPLSKDKPDVRPNDVFHKQALIIPIIGVKNDSKSVIGIKVANSRPSRNPEYWDVMFDVEVFVPPTQWILKSDNLRPYLIMGEILRSLKDEQIQSLGTIEGGAFDLNFLTEEISAYEVHFLMTVYA